ncbi:hypothetical protein [Helicobacter sp.]|uniref:hypothetical protein n=1 Tax=Helicobacter sp. TaxID=218 RepID=UPI0025C29EC2|nr:hypothetical protein [Helicobacter sp.]MBR2495315.1 hypothetical protein [Helicobacter sp.]
MKRLFCVILALGIFGLGTLSAQTSTLEADETHKHSLAHKNPHKLLLFLKKKCKKHKGSFG